MENARISILFDTPEVEKHRTFISYDFLSLIGEVGGILGLTLGASALSLTESLLQHMPHYFDLKIFPFWCEKN